MGMIEPSSRVSGLHPGKDPSIRRTAHRKRPDRDVWHSALMTGDGEILLGAVRNYLGRIKTPYDKRTLVARLEGFLLRPEIGAVLVSLLDRLDMAILGTVWLTGPLLDEELKGFFLGEMPLFELGLRIANLNDRLLLFRFQEGGRRLLALNPLVEGIVLPVVLDPENFLSVRDQENSGGSPEMLRRKASPLRKEAASDADHGADGSKSESCIAGVEPTYIDWSPAMLAVAMYCFLHHNPGWIRKDGGISKKGLEKLYPALSGAKSPEIESMAIALSASGFLPMPVRESLGNPGKYFRLALHEWGADLPIRLAVGLACTWAGNLPREDPRDLTGCLVTALRFGGISSRFIFSRHALTRWIAIHFHLTGLRTDARKIVEALEYLGVFKLAGNGLCRVYSEDSHQQVSHGKPILVMDGTHTLHLLPETKLADRLFLGTVARPVSLGKVWSFEVERSGFRRALGIGYTLRMVQEKLESLSGRALPQSLYFSLQSWESDYRSLRLYRGTVLVADDRLRPIIEHALILDPFIAEIIAPGIYFLKSMPPQYLERALVKAGLEIPPLSEAPAPDVAGRNMDNISGTLNASQSGMFSPDHGVPWGDLSINPIFSSLSLSFSPLTIFTGSVAPHTVESQPLATGTELAARLDPKTTIEKLKKALEALGDLKTESELREIADRIDRRLILTESQMMEADARSDRQEAGGLDYQGKVRVVEKTLKVAGDRLEIICRPPGDTVVCLMVRPVRLEKTEKGMILEAEDLATGGPVRINLGAASAIRRVRASLFGEET